MTTTSMPCATPYPPDLSYEDVARHVAEQMYNTDRVGERFDHRDMPAAGEYPSRRYDSFATHVNSEMHDTDNVGDDVYAFHNQGGGVHPARSVQYHDEPVPEMNRYDRLAAEVAAESHEIEHGTDHAGLGPDCDEPKLLHKNSNSEDVAWEVEKAPPPPPPAPPPPVVEEPERRAPVNIAGGRRHEDDPMLEKSEASSTDATFASMMR
jgi:hypothetical protein